MPLAVLCADSTLRSPDARRVLPWCDGLTLREEVATREGGSVVERGLGELRRRRLLHHARLPRQAPGLLINPVGEELLVFDPRTQRAHCLPSLVAWVFRQCDGETLLVDLLDRIDAETLRQILYELEHKQLIIPRGLGRRDFLSTMGRAAAAMSLIGTVLAPSPAAAVSEELLPGLPAIMPEVQPDTEDYANLPENEFLAVDRYPLSTFSVDVDTASYSNVRRFLTEGKMPPPDAVRVEEMVNYFVYDYPRPAGQAPFSITTEVAACPWNTEHQLMRIGIQGRPLEGSPPPRNLVFLLDVSGSMSDSNKLPLLKKAMRTLVETLTQKDKVAIVVYAGASGLVLPSTIGSEKQRILQALDGLEAGGSTNGGSGIELAYRVAGENYLGAGINRVILATDGDFNLGTTSQGELMRLIGEKRKTGVFLTVLGLGTGNLKDSTMEMLADRGNGNYAYFDKLAEARKVLVAEGGATLVTIAKDVKIQVEFNPRHVSAYRLIGYENRVLKEEDFKDDSKDAGEIGAGHRVTALYELVRPGQPDLAAGSEPLRYQSGRATTALSDKPELLIVKVRYKPPDQGKSRELEHVVARTQEGEPSGDFRFAAAVAGFGMLLRNSRFKAQANYRLVAELAQGALARDDEGYRREFLELVKKAQRLA